MPGRPPLLLLLASSLALHAAGTAAAPVDGDGCRDFLYTPDPPHDPVLLGSIPAYPHFQAPPLDFIGYGMALQGSEVTLNATFLAPPPRLDATETYRYWLGFHVQRPDGSMHRLDVRIHHTTTYDEGVLVDTAPQPDGTPGGTVLGRFPVSWDGAMATVRFPVETVTERHGGTAALLGSPRAASDGPHRLGDGPQGPATGAPYLQDWAHASPAGVFTPVPEGCTDGEPAGGPPAVPPHATGAPGPGAAVVLAIVALAARAAASATRRPTSP